MPWFLLAACSSCFTSISLAFCGEMSPETDEATPEEKVALQELRTVPGCECSPFTVYLGHDTRDSNLALLDHLPRLRNLSIHGNQITDAGLAHLARLLLLKKLSLKNTTITGAGFARLGNLTQLESLDVSNTGVNDAALVHVGRYGRLQELCLRATKISDDGLTHLRSLSRLHTLDLDRNGISGTGLHQLGALLNLSALRLDHTLLRDENLKYLEPMKQLRYLDLSGTPVTDNGLTQLARLPELDTVTLDQTRATLHGVIILRKALPKCWVEFDYPEPAKPAAFPPAVHNTITNSIGMKLVLIPAGEFVMGCQEPVEQTIAFFKRTYSGRCNEEALDHEEALELETPVHGVRITRPFYFGTCHVTRRQFRRFIDEFGYSTDAERLPLSPDRGWSEERKALDGGKAYSWRAPGFPQTDDHPVVCVSWNDAVAFCKWLSKKEGKIYRLPTEAEWEYACRAGTRTRYWCGDDPEGLAKTDNVADASAKARNPALRATLRATDGYVFTAPVCSFKPNPFGLYDMHGNAHEWCSDWIADYRTRSTPDDPKGPDKPGIVLSSAAPGTSDDDTARVIRGGAWCSMSMYARSTSRDWRASKDGNCTIGFRIVREVADYGGHESILRTSR